MLMETADARANDLMARQHGLLTRQQAFDAGLSPGQIQRRLASGAWKLVGPSTYASAAAPAVWPQAAAAACLSGSVDAVSSNLTAADLNGLARSNRMRPEITVPFGRSTQRPDVTVHRARLHPIDRTVVDGVPTTTVARTIIDCAGWMGTKRLKALVDTAMHQQRNLTVRAVEAAWDRSQAAPGRHGRAGLWSALDDWREEIRPGSPAEMRLRRQLVQWGFPEPEHQVPIEDEDGIVIARADLGWIRVKVGFEYDSDDFHGPDRWAADERRHQKIERLGWTLLHADALDLRARSRDLLAALRRAWPPWAPLAA
jgi:hypothetical protein